ncbi:MAG: type II secretion system secretin GspD [Moraxellaceae bacterium]|nr:type II secretion system secretin GspD [Pseudobdellovibrionaceae bacterium]
MTLKKSTPYNEILKNLLVGFFITQLCVSVSYAQFEDFPPPPPPGLGDESGAIPPSFQEPVDVPAPANGAPVRPSTPVSNRGGSTPSNQYIKPANGNAKTSILSEKQKSKFAKAHPEDITSENFPETIESFDFPNVEITDIIKAISELTGKNFIIDSTVRGKITIIAPSKITVAEAYKAFLSSLAINGFTVVPSGGFLKIRNARSAQRDGIDIYSGSYYPNTDQMITKVVHLKHITAETLKTQLGRLLNSSYGEIEAYPQTNSMIISDFGSSIDRIMKIINQLDVPGFEEQLEVVGIKFAKAKDIADLIDKVVNKGQKPASGGGFNGGGGRFAAAPGAVASKGAGTSSFLVFPDDRTNSLIIIGNRAGIGRVKKLISQLDFKVSAESQGGVYVYYVKHGEAEKIAATLSEVAKDSAPKAPPTNSGFGFQPQGQAAVREGVFGGDVSIKPDKGTNSLVISASKQDYEKVMNILSKLDIPRDQVFVESIVMEMNMSDGFESSGGLVKFDKDGGKAGFVGKTSDLTDILSPLAGAGNAILGFSSGSVSVNDPISGKATTLPNLLGFLKFIKKYGKTNILSTPQISAMDAQEAEIEVGDSVVTRTTIIPGSNGNPSLSQPEFADATIKLTIKPFISPSSETIRMEFKQVIKQISNVQVPSSFEGKVQPLATRNMKTNLVLNNGDTAVIGGLMKDEEIEQTKKVPVLGDLPILGWLFKSKDVTKTKVNMLVFLTPRIIRNGTDQKRMVQEKTNDRLNFLKKNGGKDPYGNTIDKILKREARVPQGVQRK